MIYFILGIITGLLLALIVIVVSLRYKTPLERTLNQIQSRTSEKGSILEPEDESFSSWIKSLKEET